MDEWREEWALSAAEGFGLRGLSTLVLLATVVLCTGFAIVSASGSGLVSGLLAKPFALPTSTLLVLARVVLSSLLILVEQFCTVLYYLPAGAVALAAASALAYRSHCQKKGIVPFWARLAPPPPLNRQVVLLKRIPVPLVPPVYYKGISLPAAIQELAEQPGAGWPPTSPGGGSRPRDAVEFTLGDDTRRLLAQRESSGGPAVQGAASAAAAKAKGVATSDWRLTELQSAMGRAQLDVRGVAASRRVGGGGARGALNSLLTTVKAAAGAGAAAVGAEGGEPMAQLRSRFGSMSALLQEGAAQARADSEGAAAEQEKE